MQEDGASHVIETAQQKHNTLIQSTRSDTTPPILSTRDGERGTPSRLLDSDIDGKHDIIQPPPPQSSISQSTQASGIVKPLSLGPVQRSSIRKSKPKKMSMTTFFQYTHTSQLPLPSPKPGQNPRDVASNALSIAVALLQSPQTMTGLNPLVEKFEVINPSDPDHKNRLVPLDKLASEFNVDISQNSPPFSHFEITDKFQLPFGYSKDLVYRTAMRNTLDGMESLTDPGSGVSIHAKWSVKESTTHPGEYLEMTEINYVHCNMFLSMYIKSQLGSSHKTLHDGFLERYMEGMGHPIQ